MKASRIVTAGLCLIAVTGLCQIEWLSPLPTGNSLTSAWFFDEQTGIIAANNTASGKLLIATDSQ